MPIIQARDLTCGYDSGFILKDINFKAQEREFIGVIGPNGSGKTTLLRALTKVIRPQRGEIFYDGQNIEQLSLKELARKIALVSQIPDAELKMDVEEFVLLGRIPYRKKWQILETKADKEAADMAMSLTGTLRFKERFVGSLSAGERQLVLVARALAQGPRLLFLDEPTSHLDIAHQVKILDLLKKLNQENGITIITVLHDLNLASEYCQQLVLLDNGKIFRRGVPDEVLTYQNIEEVYKTVVVVEKNPVSRKPYILLVPEEERNYRLPDRQRK